MVHLQNTVRVVVVNTVIVLESTVLEVVQLYFPASGLSMLLICNMFLVTVALFGKSQLYVTDSLPVALHVKNNARPSIIVLFAGSRVITSASRSKEESRQV